ncbi:hypothetical protein RBY4I_1283 [Rhodobacterales bacterium Y4I]|nr:hypothetical protein RBY4I_1283 [Rhodobacterales bacterium Y4I]
MNLKRARAAAGGRGRGGRPKRRLGARAFSLPAACAEPRQALGKGAAAASITGSGYITDGAKPILGTADFKTAHFRRRML